MRGKVAKRLRKEAYHGKPSSMNYRQYGLTNKIENSEIHIHTDLKILSPKNNIIVAHKK